MMNAERSISFIKPVFLPDLVRLGNANDGGYVINRRCIDSTEHLIGLGINADWSFERDFLKEKPDVMISCFDFSVSARKFFKNAVQNFYNPIESFQWLTVMLKFVRFFRANRKFYRKGITDYSNDYFIQFNDVFEIIGLERPPKNKIFLKIDIEQSEFRIMNQVMEHASAINGMAIEFHDIDILWDRFTEIIAQLSTDFLITHVHGNNCGEAFTPNAIPRAFEITFVKKELVSDSERSMNQSIQYPIPGLDAPNEPSRKDFTLNFE